jgi:hypothetical protein
MEELEQVLQYGTIFMNTASLHWKALADLCIAASGALHFPTNVNVYITGQGRKVSTDVHTDNHDVFIFHTKGVKHWRVYPPPRRSPGMAHPLYRGKHDDKLLESELDDPLIDILLQPGEVLFIPMGFPHATATAGTGSSKVSVHLTLGISAADYGFCMGGLRRSLLAYLGEDSTLDEANLPDDVFWELMAPVPAGCLLPDSVRKSANARTSYLDFVIDRLAGILVAAEKERWEDLDATSLRIALQRTVITHLNQQLLALVSQDEAYREVSAAIDGVFHNVGAEESRSEFRRSMLDHQAQEDERKRRRAPTGDERFIKRIDPSDGCARTKLELKELYFKRGYASSEIEQYWDSQCKQIYPNDEPPEGLVDELERACETCADLMYFLRKRTPHLQTRSIDTERPVTAMQPLKSPCIDIKHWERVD